MCSFIVEFPLDLCKEIGKQGSESCRCFNLVQAEKNILFSIETILFL